MKKYLQAAAIWLAIVPLAILNGGFRDYVLVGLGRAALPLSGMILSACIFAVAFCLVPRIKGCRQRDYALFGGLWFLLTNLFDLAMYWRAGGGLSDLLAAYRFWTGNLWALVTASALLAPWAAGKRRKKRQ